jgi:Asp-tRNA(Asn)/Glu-tRNA(Gln) amidotransferase A subunit family amidase
MDGVTTMSDLLRLTAVAAAAAIRTRDVSPVELVGAVLDGVERTQGTLNAFMTVCAEEARAQAREAEEAVMRGGPLPPLWGVPFS